MPSANTPPKVNKKIKSNALPLVRKISADSSLASSQSSRSDAWSTREIRPSSSLGPAPLKPNKPGRPASISNGDIALSSSRLLPPFEFSGASLSDQTSKKTRRIERWLEEQEKHIFPLDAAARERIQKAAGTPSNPYLAYPNLSNHAVIKENHKDDVASLRSFVIVEEDEPRETQYAGPSLTSGQDNVSGLEPPLTDLLAATVVDTISASAHTPSSLRAPRPASILSISSWRNLPFTKTLPHPRRSFSTPGEPIDLSTPPSTLRKASVSRRRSPIPLDFLNAETSGNLRVEQVEEDNASLSIMKSFETPRNSMRYRLSNLMKTHSNASPQGSEVSPSSTASSSPRPSTSASTTTTSVSIPIAVEDKKRSLRGGSSIRFIPKFNISLSKASSRQVPVTLSSPTQSTFSAGSLCSQGDEAPPLPAIPSEFLYQVPLTRRTSNHSVFKEKKHSVSSSALSTLSIGSIGSVPIGKTSSILGTSTGARRRKLVVSGIEPDNVPAVQGLRRWCEGFGELRQINRMPNGDLIVDFKRADVADTVCRISARVHIADVGSVNLTWISGKRR